MCFTLIIWLSFFLIYSLILNFYKAFRRKVIFYITSISAVIVKKRFANYHKYIGENSEFLFP